MIVNDEYRCCFVFTRDSMARHRIAGRAMYCKSRENCVKKKKTLKIFQKTVYFYFVDITHRIIDGIFSWFSCVSLQYNRSYYETGLSRLIFCILIR